MLIDLDQMKAQLKPEEGVVPYAYKDSLGFLTIGVGRLIDKRKGGKLSDEEIDFLLTNDITNKYVEIENTPWFLAADTDARRRALLDMYFQLGGNIYGFKKSLAAIEAGDWDQAARRLKQSLWRKQTPNRADKIIAMLKDGV